MNKTLEIIINAQKYELHTQFMTGIELKKLAGVEESKELYLSISEPWTDELIQNDTNVDLARTGIEHFYVKHYLQFSINGEKHEWKSQYITGLQLREIGKVNPGFDLYLHITPPYEDELINNDTRVDLARPGTEHFITKEKPCDIIIIVNGREREWKKTTISFAEVVILAFGAHNENATTAYTVTYKRGQVENPEGSMVKGDIVHIKTKMIFNVTATDKS